MTISGDFAKGFLIVWCVAFLFLIIEFLIMGQTALAGLMILGFIFPFSIVLYDYRKKHRDKKPLADNSKQKELERTQFDN